MDKNISVNVSEDLTLAITVGTGAGQTAYTKKTQNLVLHNAGTAVIFVKSGGASVDATGGFPILPGAIMTVTKALNDTHLGHISGTAAQALYATQTDGV